MVESQTPNLESERSSRSGPAIFDDMVEWLKATVCKTDDRNIRVGSNPTIVTEG